MKRLCLAIGMLLSIALGFNEVQAQTSMRSVVGVGAQQTEENGLLRISGTFGQAIIGTQAVATQTTHQGFWGPLARTTSTSGQAVAGLPAGHLGVRATENPFTTTTQLEVYLPQSGVMTVRLYDGLGREVAVLYESETDAGTHRIVLDGTHLSSGRYVVSVINGGEQQSLSLLLVQ